MAIVGLDSHSEEINAASAAWNGSPGWHYTPFLHLTGWGYRPLPRVAAAAAAGCVCVCVCVLEEFPDRVAARAMSMTDQWS